MASSPFDRKTSVYVAKLAERAQRYDDMMEAMKEVAREVEKMTEIERNLLAGGFMGKLAAPRQSWRILCEMEKEQGAEVKIIMEYKKKLGEKIGDACREVLAIIEKPLKYSIDRLGPDAYAAVFYYMLKGDCYRYLVEIETKERKKVADEALKAYEDATKIAPELPNDAVRRAQKNQIAEPTQKADRHREQQLVAPSKEQLATMGTYFIL